MKKLQIVLCCVLACMIFQQSVHAEEAPDTGKAVIFVIDTSGSMQANDPDRLAVDSIAQLIYSLPTDYRVGLVAYSAGITARQAPVAGDERKKAAEQAMGLGYEGYSNAGEGLMGALGLLADDPAREKYIIMLSDGEILLENESRTSEAAAQYQAAIEQAKAQGVTIHVIGLGSEMSDMGNLIFSAAEETGGSAFYGGKAEDIQEAVDAIRTNEFGIKQSTLAIVDADGGVENISARLPYLNADKVRILITCEKPVRNLKVSLQAEGASQINGKRYAVIEIHKPTDDRLEVSFEGTAGSRVWVSAIPEYHVVPRVSVQYTDTVPPDADLTVEQPYDRMAQITYTFASVDNPAVQLWNQEYFDHGRIVVTRKDGAEETPAELFLQNGCLTVQERVADSQAFTACFDYSGLAVNVIGAETLPVELEAPPMMPVEEPQPPYLLIGVSVLCVVLLILAVLLAAWHRNRKKPVPLPPDAKPEPSRYSYVGKLNIYITRTSSGYDIPPLSYDLFRLPPGKVISLYEVLDSCGVKERFPGAETVYLKAGGGRSLILTNNSDCTVMKNREILLKTRSYQLTMDAKVDITFEDEISELAFQYKDVKLSAMH